MTWDEYSPIGPMTYIGDRSGKVPTVYQKVPWRCDQGHEGKWHRNYLDSRRRNKPVTGRPICPECSKLLPMKRYEHYLLSTLGPKLLTRNIEILTSEEKLKRMDFYNFRCSAPGCEHEWRGPLTQILTGSGCPRCSGKERWTTESFIQACIAVHEDDYDYSRTLYVNRSTKIIIWCKKCGKDFEQFPTGHLHMGCGCPKCAPPSKGEKILRKIFTNLGFDWRHNRTYSGLVGPNGGLLKYDLWIPTLGLLIEYHGTQHYSEIQHRGIQRGHATVTFQSRVIYDRLKVEYAKRNNIPMIVIPEWHLNEMEEIVNCILDDTDFIPIYNARVERETNEKYPELKNIQG